MRITLTSYPSYFKTRDMFKPNFSQQQKRPTVDDFRTSCPLCHPLHEHGILRTIYDLFISAHINAAHAASRPRSTAIITIEYLLRGSHHHLTSHTLRTRSVHSRTCPHTDTTMIRQAEKGSTRGVYIKKMPTWHSRKIMQMPHAEE